MTELKELMGQMIAEWAKSKGKNVAIDEGRLGSQVSLAEEIYRRASSAENGTLFVLRAPTGFGKTEVLFAPFLYQFVARDWFAPRMYLVEPVNALLKQMEERARLYSKLVSPTPTVGSDYGDTLKRTFLYTSVITLTTVDSAFYGFVAKRVMTWRERGGAETGRYSMPAGLLTGSYLVFDEAHLVQDQAFLGPRVMAKVVCSIVGAGGTVVFSSATLPDAMLKLFREECEGLGAEIHVLPQPKVEREVRLTYTGKQIFEAECGEREVIFVNTIERAIKMKEKCKGAVLLHSAMRKDDKERVLEELKKGATLIATQTAEVGIDYDFVRVKTELAPMDSLIQRFGRVRKGVAEAEVYEVDSPLPYDRDVMNRTRGLVQSTRVIRAGDVDDLINKVYDDAIIERLSGLGDALYLSTVEYLHDLTLFSYPPESEPYLRPSNYVTLYLLRDDELEKVKKLYGKYQGTQDREDRADLEEGIREILINSSVKISISLLNDYNKERLLTFLSNFGGRVLDGCLHSSSFLNDLDKDKILKRIGNSDECSDMIVLIDKDVYTPDLGLKGLIEAKAEVKESKKRRGRKK